MVIYGDILLALNWWIDYLLLLGVRRALGCGGKGWRVALAALIGAVSSLVLLLPPLPLWLSLGVKLGTAVLMVLVAFRRRTLRDFVRRVLLLFGLSAGLAGLCGALYFFAAPTGFYVYNGVVYYTVPPLLLVGLTVVCYAVLTAVESILRRRAPARYSYRVRLTFGDKQTDFLCLYDSGNHLVEPFSGYPVLVVERSVAEEVLEVPASLEQLPPHSEAGWRLVPYDTLGGSGLLPAFVPRWVQVMGEDVAVTVEHCYVAVCDRLGRGEYRGLMGSAVGEDLIGKGRR